MCFSSRSRSAAQADRRRFKHSMSESHWWDIVEKILHYMWLFLAAVSGYLYRKFSHVEERMDELDKLCTERGHRAEMNHAVMQSYHESNTQRLGAIDARTQRMDEKLDDVIMSLRKP